MNRTIKFRLWNKKEKRFIYSDWKYGELSFWEHYCHDFTKEYEEIQQFTGLLDKNGKEIYEGDIIKATNENDETDGLLRGIIEFSNRLFSYVFIDEINYEYYITSYDLEIIGNVFENIELLK